VHTVCIDTYAYIYLGICTCVALLYVYVMCTSVCFIYYPLFLYSIKTLFSLCVIKF
jgi:hypothetical protein